ncbi:MAG TPA: PKD domain-containing protein [Holophagaceae bacterium]|nr:PKD domain-containing protein [Holophagaceae bacterium]
MFLALLPAMAQAQSCGVERWSVKTGTDPDAGLVSLASPQTNTIATLRGWPAPNPIPANNRVSPYETTVWVINATLTEFKLENDSDIHLVLQDANGLTMIAEIPAPACVGASSPFASGISNARSEFTAVYTPTTSFQTVSVPVKVTGVGMFDFLHGQTGVAPNGIELHPVIDIQFNPTASNTVSATITSPSGNLTLASGTAVSFAGSASDSSASATLTYGWTFGDGGTATGASANHTFTNTGSTAVTRTVTFTATDSTGAKGTATRTVTVNPAAGTNTVQATITSPAGSVTVASGTAVSFAGSATDSSTSATLSYGWTFGDGGTATGTSASHTFTNTGTTAVTRTVTFTATDSTGVSGSATRSVTVNPATSTGTQLLANPGFESGNTAWSNYSSLGGGGAVISSDMTNEPSHAGSWDAWLNGYGSTDTDTLSQSVAIPATATSATLSFWLHVDTAETTTSTAYDKLLVQVQDSGGTVLATLGTFSNLNAGSGYTKRSYDLTAYKGKTVKIYFKGTEDSSYQSSFVVDDAALLVQ